MENSGLYYKQLCEELAQRIQLLEAVLSKKKKKKKSKLDPVGKEDDDIDNDGKSNTSRDKYLKNRREQIGQAMKGKKQTIKEGTVVTDGNIFYGGFPRKLNEQGLVNQYNDAYDAPGEPSIAKRKGKKIDEDVAWTDDYLPGNKKMSGIGVKELQKILAGGGSPVLGTGKNASPEIIAAAKMHLDAVSRGPSPEQAKSAYQFFRQHFPHMGVEDEIGVMHDIAGHTPVEPNANFPKTENKMRRR